MRKVLVIGSLLVVTAVASLAIGIKSLTGKQAPVQVAGSGVEPKNIAPRNPNVHDFSDVDYAQKKLLHHQLGALIADKAKADAVWPEIRQTAERVSAQETERASVYAGPLASWGEKYLNITDFPESSGCNGYPTFSGMLPHVDVGSYRLSNGEDVDAKFLSLLIEYHERADDLVTLEGTKIGYGELVKLRNDSQKEYAAEIGILEMLQKSLPQADRN